MALRFSCRQSVLALILPVCVAAVGAKELTIGIVAPQSGPAAVYGREALAGAKAYIDRVNATGGVNGAQLRLEVRDDQFDVAKTVALTNELIQRERPVALLCGVGTANWIAVTKDGILQRSGVPVVGVMTPATVLRDEPYRQLFFLRPTLQDEIRRMAQQLSTTSFNTRVGVLYQDDAFGKDALAGLQKVAPEFGITAVATVGYARDAGKVEAATREVLESQPTALLVLGTSGAVTRTLKVVRERAFPGPVISSSVVDPRDVVQALTPEGARGLILVQVMPNPRSPTLPAAIDLRRDLNAGSGKGEQVSTLAMEGYLSARLVVEALKRAGANPGPREVYAALSTTPKFDLGGFSVAFDATNRTGSRKTEISIINWQGNLLY